MKHQLQPNTYTVCESPEQCKELFEWAKENGVFAPYDYYEDEDSLLFEDKLFTLCENEIYSTDVFILIPLTEFIARLKGTFKD